MSIAVCVLLASALGAGPAAAQSCSADLTCQYLACRAPASGVPSTLWGELKPVDVGQLPGNRDNTSFYEFSDPFNETEPHWMSLDIEGGWIFAAINLGLEVWDARNNPASPTRVEVLGRNDFPNWAGDPHETYPVRDVDAPPGNPNVVAVAQVGGGGLAIFDASSKSNVVDRYGDRNKTAAQVYAGRVNGTDYAFTATQGQGVLAYNMTAAYNRSTLCVETTPGQTGCGVYVRRIDANRLNSSFIDGEGNAAGTGLWLAFSSGATAFGMEVWDVSNPASPQQRISALGTSFVYGVALWRKGSSYYLGARVLVTGGTELRIYNVSCLASNSCGGSLGALLKTVSLPAGGSEFYVTHSQGNGRDFLFLGTVDKCSQGLQKEWLFDVTTPGSAADITPPAKLLNGVNTGYWGWYYRRNPTGFNQVAPRVGKFNGIYFYRAANTIFDIHELTTPGPPTAAFSFSPATVYQGEEVDFTDQSLGLPNQWSWTFQDGNPSTSAQQNPTGVTFGSTGSKQVTLEVANAVGSHTANQNLQVLPPGAQVGSVTASPNPALVCQPVTFTALGVSGVPPVALSWELRNLAGGLVDSAGNVNPFVWDTTTATPGDGPFTATVTALNAQGSDSAASPAVTLNPLTPLAFTSPGGAPETLNGPPFGGPNVDFRIQAQGATEWRWDFGDGTPLVWASDPVTGPAPSHTYAANGTYPVTVEIRNCAQGAIPSNPTQVTIDNSTPLIANFTGACLFPVGGSCFVDPGTAIAFTDSSQGSPDFWDYDWNGDGSFEDGGHPAPVNSHTYNADGTHQPRLRVRRGTAGESLKVHDKLYVVGNGGQPAVAVNGPAAGETGQQLTFTALLANCPPLPATWSWSVGAGGSIVGSATGSTITVVYSTAGTKTVQANPGSGACTATSGSRQVLITLNNSIFSDGFESGDLSAWISSAGGS